MLSRGADGSREPGTDRARSSRSRADDPVPFPFKPLLLPAPTDDSRKLPVPGPLRSTDLERFVKLSRLRIVRISERSRGG